MFYCAHIRSSVYAMKWIIRLRQASRQLKNSTDLRRKIPVCSVWSQDYSIILCLPITSLIFWDISVWKTENRKLHIKRKRRINQGRIFHLFHIFQHKNALNRKQWATAFVVTFLGNFRSSFYVPFFTITLDDWMDSFDLLLSL